ncbi:MAG: hypothetical protein O2U61_05595, partial [Candidatus Bathyarchaeota archaeon]|nr:hypothetical protein [Candidatus Bathyarchaeota archaeon]
MSRRFVPKNHQRKTKIIRETAQKGNSGLKTVEVDAERVREIVKSLQPYANKNIKDLTGEAEENYKNLLVYVSITYRSDYYEKLCDLISENFICPNPVIPGTVAGYICGGVVASKRGDLDCCSLMCSGAINPNRKKCTHNILKAYRKSDGYNFEEINKVSSNETCIIYVPELKPSNFSGFNEKERKLLKKYAKKFKIMGYSGDQEVTISDDFKDLDDIKGSSVFSTDYITKPGNGFLIILVSVIILLLLIVIGWRVITSSRNNTSPREEYRF